TRRQCDDGTAPANLPAWSSPSDLAGVQTRLPPVPHPIYVQEAPGSPVRALPLIGRERLDGVRDCGGLATLRGQPRAQVSTLVGPPRGCQGGGIWRVSLRARRLLRR